MPSAVLARWIVVSLPADYYRAGYRKLFRDVIHPIVRAHRAIEANCVTDGFTEAEYKLPNLKAAQTCARDLNRRFRAMIAEEKRDPAVGLLDRLGRMLAAAPPQIGPIAVVTDPDYEVNGSRNIVRRDTSFRSDYAPRVCRGFQTLFRTGMQRDAAAA